MEIFYDALFEISNEDRHKILIQVGDEAMNVTQLAKKFDLSLTETSRHLSRTMEVGLVKKDADGLYHLSPFGKLFLSQVLGAEFVSNHWDYFNAHNLECLPKEMVHRLAELRDSTYVDDVMRVFFNINRMMQEAEEYFWNITDQYIMSTLPLVKRVAYENVKARSIDKKGYIFPTDMKASVSEEDIDAAYKAKAQGNIKMKMLDRIDVFLWMSEKEVAALAFPLLKGGFDYLGFTSKDEWALKWCRELFQYYWDKAEPKYDFSLF